MNALPNELPVELEEAWRALDADATRRAARVDADAMAARVLARLRDDPATARLDVLLGRWTLPSVPRWVRVSAAAAMVVLVAGSMVLRVYRARGDAVAVPVVAVALDSLSANELDALLKVTADVRPVATAVEPAPASWDNLSETQLRAVLQAVQQVQGETL